MELQFKMPVSVTPLPTALSFLLAFCHPCNLFSCCFSGIHFHKTSAGKPFLGLLIHWALIMASYFKGRGFYRNYSKYLKWIQDENTFSLLKEVALCQIPVCTLPLFSCPRTIFESVRTAIRACVTWKHKATT